MRKFFTLMLLMALFGLTTIYAQTTRTYAESDMSALLTDLTTAVDGDVFELTTSGGIYVVDTMSVEVNADITIRAADGLENKPVFKLVYDSEKDMVDYIIRLTGEDVVLNLEGLVVQGDTNKTKYGIRTAKVSDMTDYSDYDDPNYDLSVVQVYELNINDCEITGIKKSSDGRGIILYPGTRGTVNITNTTFSAIERDAIDMYNDTDNTTANGPWKFVDNMTIKNCTFYNVGREAVLYRNSSEISTDNPAREAIIDISYCTFDDCGGNSPSDSYYPLRVDQPEIHIMSSIFSNMISKSYIVGDNKNEASTFDNLVLWNIMKWDTDNGVEIEFENIADAFSVESVSIGESIWLNTYDPMYADIENADFTIGAASPLATMSIGDLRWTKTNQYTVDQIDQLITDLDNAVDGDVFELTTPGGVYTFDDYLAVNAKIVVRAAYGLEEKPILKKGGGDYIVRLTGEDVGLEMSGLELQGDSTSTKYALRTAKIGDNDIAADYTDCVTNGLIEQTYYLIIDNCDINGIKSGSDGRGLILYPGTLGTLVKITNTTFSAIERDAIDAYINTSETEIGYWKFVDSMVVENTTFHHVGRDAITVRTGDDPVAKSNKLFLNHCTFDSVGWNNSDPGKYHSLEIDYVDATITNTIFTNDVSDDYVVTLNHENAFVDYLGVYNLGTVEGGDTISTSNGATVGSHIFVGDPLYADPLSGNYILGKGSPFIGKASDGKALGDLRWDIYNDNAMLSDLQVDSVSIEGFESDSLNYIYELPFGTTEVPVVMATTIDPNASFEMVSATTIPGTWVVNVTAENGVAMETYTVDFTLAAASTDSTLADLLIDDVSLEGFAANIFDYTVELPWDATEIPVVTGVASDENATVVENQATELPGAATVVVTAQDGVSISTYTVNFTLAAAPTYTVTFNVVDEDALALDGAEVVFNDTTVITDDAGVAVFTEIDPVTDAAYTITKGDAFEPYSGTVTVVDEDVIVDVTLIKVGVEDFSALVNDIYPNPTHGQVSINLKSIDQNTVLTITDINGKVVAHRALNQLETKVDLSGNNAGIYFISIVSGETNFVGKVILK